VNKNKARGFSLMELLVVTVILMAVMGTVFTYINLAQRRFDTEQTKIDMTQQSREFMDSVARDLHMAGYPNRRMFQPGFLGATWYDSPRVATGIVSMSATTLLMEGDADNDGQVDSVLYQLVPDFPVGAPIPNQCPCRLQRGTLVKQVAPTPAPMNQGAPAFYIEAQGIINSAGAIPLGNVGLGNFAGYVNEPIFRAYDVAGAPIALPVDLNTMNPVTGQSRVFDIRAIRVTLNVLGSQADNQTRVRPVMSISTTVGMNNF
jgi:prepilin-type N-terminal cleavage/methylation domain-containing protein